jgi:hypothetical protein
MRRCVKTRSSKESPLGGLCASWKIIESQSTVLSLSSVVRLSSPRSKVTLRRTQSNSRPSSAVFARRSTKRSGRRPSAVTLPRLSWRMRPSRKSVKKPTASASPVIT